MSALAGVGDFGLKALADQTKSYRDEALGFVHGRFPQSLTVYVDGVAGNDSRNGTTDDTNATTGKVKTLSRIAELYSGKISRLIINITGNTDISADIDLSVLSCIISVRTGTTLTWKKKANVTDTSSVVVGDGTYYIRYSGYDLSINLAGAIVVEGNTGWNSSGNEYYYKNAQGAIRAYHVSQIIDYNRTLSVNVVGAGTLTVGNYAVFFSGSGAGLNGDNVNWKADYRRSNMLGNATVTIGTGGAEAVYSNGSKIIPRSYTPSSSTDASLSEGEMCSDSSYLYRKVAGTIKKIAWTAF